MLMNLVITNWTEAPKVREDHTLSGQIDLKFKLKCPPRRRKCYHSVSLLMSCGIAGYSLEAPDSKINSFAYVYIVCDGT